MGARRSPGVMLLNLLWPPAVFARAVQRMAKQQQKAMQQRQAQQQQQQKDRKQ
jgi:hypothetical protein